MDLKNILQDERKKKFLIIGLIVFFVVIGSILIFSRNSAPIQETTNGDGQTQLLTDISQLSPRDGVGQDQNRLIAPIVKVSADVPVVAPGQPSVISWNASNATSCVDGNGNALRTSGSLSITPQENYTMDIVCTNPKGTTIESITVAVTTSPIITLLASPKEVLKGEQSFISWTTVNTTRCVDAQGKTLRLSGGMPVVPQTPYTFEISCTGPNGTAKKSVTVGITTIKNEDKYVYVYKWRAKAGGPLQTSTFQTIEGCKSSYNNSTAYEKSVCVKVAVDSTKGTTEAGSGNGTDGAGSGNGTDGAGSGNGTDGEEILTCLNITRNLASGSTDAETEGEVTVLQKFLVRKGLLSTSITGNFGPATESAVKAFQTSAGISASGVVDAATQAEIKKVSCKDAEDAAKKIADEITGPITPPVDTTVGPKITFTLTPDTIGHGQTADMVWDIKEADSCTLRNTNLVTVILPNGSQKPLGNSKGGITTTLPDPVPFTGTYKLKINVADSPSTLTLKCTSKDPDTGGNITKQQERVLYWDGNSVTFSGPPDVAISADPTAIAQATVESGGAFSTVTWSSDNATSCTAATDAYAELLNSTTGWQKMYSDHPAVAVQTSGTIRVKPGYNGTSVPEGHQTCTTGPAPGGGGGTTTTCVQDGNGSKNYCSGGFCGMGGGSSHNSATITVSCRGPIAPNSSNTKDGKIKPTNQVTISITPTPPSGGGDW